MGIYQNLEKEYDFDIVEEFFGHYTSMVESMEKLIVALEDEKQFQRNINELFRMFHTIKSATAYLKLTPILKVVTLGEEVLEECRSLQGRASDALIEWLLAVSDQLDRYKEDLEKDRDTFTKADSRIIKIPIDYLKS